MATGKTAIRLGFFRTADDAEGDDRSIAADETALTVAIRATQSKIETSAGGIAQLVERQLCKLEVRGSNPLASKA